MTKRRETQPAKPQSKRTKTPELPLREGFHGRINEKGETVLSLVSGGKAIWQEVHDAAKIEQAVFFFLDFANESYHRTKSAPDAPHHTQGLQSVPIVKVALRTDEKPGY